MTAPTPTTDSAPSTPRTEASTPYLVWASVAAGAVMSVVWLVWGAVDTYHATAFAPLVAYVVALVVSQVRRDKLATRQLAMILIVVFVLMLFGAVVVLPLPWAVVTFAFLFAGAVSRNLRLVILGLVSSLGILLSVWPSAYADAGPGLSVGALSAAIGAAAILVANRVLSSD